MPDAGTEMERPHDAPELLRRLLALIDSVHQPQDLTAEQVMRFIRMPLKPIASSRSGGFEIFEQLTHDWLYRFIWHAHDITPDPDLGLLFYEARGSSLPRPDMTGICQLDAAEFHDALLRMGYRHISSTRRASPARQYQRGLVEVEIGIVGESNDSLDKISHDCIKRVVVGFFDGHPDRGAKR